MNAKTTQLTAARDHLESLAAAEVMAVEEITRLDKLAKKLAGRSKIERGRAIKSRLLPICVELQAGVVALGPLFAQYAGLRAQFRQVLGDTGNQVTSQWRIENLLDEQLLGRAIPKDLRVPDLADIEDRIFEGVLDRAVRDLEKQD